MPDFERLTDKLAIELAKTPEQRAYEIGFQCGKTFARLQVFWFLVGVALARTVGPWIESLR